MPELVDNLRFSKASAIGLTPPGSVIHDRYWPKPADQKYELLSPGDEFDLCCRRKVQ